MEMTEPNQILEAYKDHLNSDGGLLPDSVPQLIELMSATDGKLVPRCIALCIISASDTDVQSNICKGTAWDLLLRWLQDALKEENYAFLVELLHVYLKLPVRLEQLTQNVCPKLINSLTKRCEHDVVKSVASDIVKKWKQVISSDSKRVDLIEPVTKKKKLEADHKPVLDDEKSDKKRRSTVKMPPTSMRTAGLEDTTEVIPPKSRCEVLAKKNVKSDTEVKATLDPSIESFHQKIIVPHNDNRKAPPELHESSNFMNALTATPHPIVRKKRKLPVKMDIQISPELNTTKDDSFADQSVESQPSENELLSPSPSPVGLGARKSSLTSLLSFAEKKTKKRVSWADEDHLHTFFYFDLDESERVNVNRTSTEDIRRREVSLERQLFKRHDSAEIGILKWRTPSPLERTVLVPPGYKSVERQVQAERERYVLQAIYFTRESIPPTPEEPEPEEFDHKTPLEMPLEDLATTEDQSMDTEPSPAKNILLVNDGGSGNAQVSLKPELASLVMSLAANFTGPQPAIAQSVTSQSMPSETIVSPSEPTHVESQPLTASVEVPTLDSPYQEGQSKPVEKNSTDHHLQRELWDVLEENYPELNVRELSFEAIRELLDPLRDQLVARGIFQVNPHPMPPRPPSSQTYLPLPVKHNYPCLPPQFVGVAPPMPPEYPPSEHFPLPPPMHMRGGFMRPRGQPMRGRPPAPFPVPPHPYVRGPPPPRGPPVRRPMALPPRRPDGVGRPLQLCMFFQQGTCRNGPSCQFFHP